MTAVPNSQLHEGRGASCRGSNLAVIYGILLELLQ